jgi:hypothetical protein
MTATNGFIIGDGSWNLQIYVSDLQVERTLRVKGDLHIGGVMLRLVEDLGKSMESYLYTSTLLYTKPHITKLSLNVNPVTVPMYTILGSR